MSQLDDLKAVAAKAVQDGYDLGHADGIASVPPLVVVPPPVITPPPVVIPPPAGETLVYADDFTKYADVKAMGEPGPGQRIVPYPSPITTGAAVDLKVFELLTENGVRFLRMHYDGKNQTGPSLMGWGIACPSDTGTNHIHYRARITYPGGPPALKLVKLAIKWLEGWHHHDTGNRWQHNTHWDYSGTVRPSGAGKTFWQMYEGSLETPGQATQPVGPFFSNLADGAFHDFDHYYRPQSAPGALDGWSMMLIDGAKMLWVAKEAIGVTPAGGGRPWCAKEDVAGLKAQDGIGIPGDKSLLWGGPSTADVVSPWTYDIADVRWTVKP